MVFAKGLKSRHQQGSFPDTALLGLEVAASVPASTWFLFWGLSEHHWGLSVFKFHFLYTGQIG